MNSAPGRSIRITTTTTTTTTTASSWGLHLPGWMERSDGGASQPIPEDALICREARGHADVRVGGPWQQTERAAEIELRSGPFVR
jgi:hypothetical protein